MGVVRNGKDLTFPSAEVPGEHLLVIAAGSVTFN